MGGTSSEKEISLKSGSGIIEGLREAGFDAEGLVLNSNEVPDLRAAGFSLAFIALHGEFGEDGQLQRILERRHFPYTGSGAVASRLAMDKVAAKQKFLSAGVSTPRFRVLGDPADESGAIFAARSLGLPAVLKPVDEGSSVGIHIVRDEEELLKWLAKERKIRRRLFLEEYIAGREVTVGILDERPLPVLEIKPSREFYDFSAKYEGGTEYLPRPKLPDEVESAIKSSALLAHRSLGCKAFSRVDMRLSDEGIPYVLEVNTIPGFTRLSLLPKAAAAAGISFSQLCAKVVRLSLNGIK